MNPNASIYSENPRSTIIDPFYVKGDVFQRDSRYYDQLIGSRRSRTPGKSGISTFPPTNPILPNPISPGVVNPSIVNPPPSINVTSDQDELRRLQEEHQALLN